MLINGSNSAASRKKHQLGPVEQRIVIKTAGGRGGFESVACLRIVEYILGNKTIRHKVSR